MSALFSWDSENKTGLLPLTLKDIIKYQFTSKDHCFTLTPLLCYFKVLCEIFILYTTILLKF